MRMGTLAKPPDRRAGETSTVVDHVVEGVIKSKLSPLERANKKLLEGNAELTTANDGLLHGMTANAVTSVSLDPLLLLVCIDKSTNAHPEIDPSTRRTVTIPPPDPEDD